jgi:LemA protein
MLEVGIAGAGFVVACGFVYGVVQYNAFVALRNHIRESWADVETELKRRYELIPNLVAVVQGYAAHERTTLERVSALRSRCVANHGSPAAQAVDERELVAALREVFVHIEAYPALKADQHFLSLQRELVNTENRIQAARRFFNGNVRDYQTKHQAFPSNVIAKLFGFESEAYFAVESAVYEVPSVAGERG